MNALLSKSAQQSTVGIVQIDSLPQEFRSANRFIRWGYIEQAEVPNKFRKSALDSKGMCCGYSDQSAWLSLNYALDAAASTEVGLEADWERVGRDV